MNNDSTLTLDQRLAKHEEDFVKQHRRALEDHARERIRYLEDDFEAHPDEWEFVDRWIFNRDDVHYDRTAISAAYADGYHHVEKHGLINVHHVIQLYRKAVQS